MSSMKWCTLLVVTTFYISLTLSAPTEIPLVEDESTTISSEDSVVTTNIPKVESVFKNAIGNTERKNVEVENGLTTDSVDESETTEQTLGVGIKSDEGYPTIQTPVVGNISLTQIIDDKDVTTTETTAHITENPTTSVVDHEVVAPQIPEDEVNSTAHLADGIKHSTEIPEENPEVTTKLREEIDETITHITQKSIKLSTRSDVDSTTHSADGIDNSTEIPEKTPEVTTEVTEKIDESTTQISETTNSSSDHSNHTVTKIIVSSSAIKNDPSSTGGATFSKTLNFHLIISASLISYITFSNH